MARLREKPEDSGLKRYGQDVEPRKVGPSF